MMQEALQHEDDDDFDVSVEIVDDTPEKDRGKPRRADGVEPQIPEDDEIAQYSDNVQKRIKQLRYEYHEERRAKEEASRAREEAIKYAEAVHRENQRLMKTLEEGEGVLVQQAKGRLQAEIDKAKRAYKEGRPIKEVAQEMTQLSAKQLDRLLNPLEITKGGITGSK